MSDEDRVFDVSRPGRKGPSATGRPVIVGHHPMMSDPMVRESGEPDERFLGQGHSAPTSTRIHVSDKSTEETPPKGPTSYLDGPPTVDGPAVEDAGEPDKPGLSAPDDIPAMDPTLETTEPDTSARPGPAGIITPPSQPKFGPKLVSETSHDEPLVYRQHHHRPPRHPSVEPLPVEAPPKKKSHWPLVILIILLIIIGVYLALDSGLIKNNLNLPVHFFKQKTPTPAVQTPPPAPAKKSPAANTNVPDGFKLYKISGTQITFAAPVAWGAASSTTEPGYTKRGGNNQSDGTYAYLVSFDTNKDIQMVVTSSQYLPVARAATYYDYLQWCVGTDDGAIYQTLLHFSTTKGVDTPTTATCDQGPLSATKLNSTTIEQAAAKDSQGNTIGDIYTKNLTDKDLPVLRVKDAAMKNGADIKTLLNTVQVAPSANS